MEVEMKVEMEVEMKVEMEVEMKRKERAVEPEGLSAPPPGRGTPRTGAYRSRGGDSIRPSGNCLSSGDIANASDTPTISISF